MIRRRSTIVFWTLLLIATGFNLQSSRSANGERPYGLAKRVPWTTSRITGSPEPPPPYQIERVFSKLQFKNPVVLTKAPNCERLFLAELRGKVYSFAADPACEQADLFADLAKDIKGLRRVYGLAFHPDFPRKRICYICYVLDENNPVGTRVSRFKVNNTDPPTLDSASEEILLTWRAGGHNGGCLKFGPDGYLYISTGDAGPAFPPDPLFSGQDVSNLLSSILRIDVDKPGDDKPYSIPADNPFITLDDTRGEVWAYGLRNPWKMSFDPATGDLWVGDVGWELWEMIYRVERGGNYGWSLVEGPQPVHRERTRGPTPILPATFLHSHIESRSITGGHVYRGSRLKALVGAYIYGDYVTGKIWAGRLNGDNSASIAELVDTSLQIICFGTDHAGELFVVGYDGTIHRLIPNPSAAANENFPTRLSETGLFASVKDHAAAQGVIPYSINAEPWMDGATAERFVALPGLSKLDVYKDTNVQVGYIKGRWKFPTDGVLVKTISLEMKQGDPTSRRRLETQMLHFDVDTWRAYTYIWNEEQTDAQLAPVEGLDHTFTIIDHDAPGGKREQAWRFAGRSQCLLCHSTRGGSVYGFQPEQLNREHDYGGVKDNQLRTLAHIGLFTEPPANDVRTIPSPHDESASLEDRARSYLHVNCASCHLRGGGGTASIELLWDLPLERTNLLDARPTQGTFGIHGAQVLAPGDPYRSVLFYRMAKLGRGRMPYFGSSEVDLRGLKLMHDWIAQMPADASVPESVAERRKTEKTVLEQLKSNSSDADERRHDIDELLASTNGALVLLHALGDETLNGAVKQDAIARAAKHDDIQIRDLFERLVPPEQRTKRLGSTVDPAEILSLSGSAERGKTLFFSAAVQCKNCHRIGEEGTPLGPDLSQIGKKYDRAALLESILEPSKQIDPKFQPYLVETKRGRVHTGLLLERTEEQVVLKDAANKEIRIVGADIELVTPLQKSLMPELLVQDLTADQLADLLEYLGALR